MTGPNPNAQAVELNQNIFILGSITYFCLSSIILKLLLQLRIQLLKFI